jgi:nucleolar protein 14
MQGDALDENYALDDEEAGAAPDSDESDGEDSDEDTSGSGEDDEPDDLRRSFKGRVGSINRQGNLQRGLRRLRRLGILKDGGDAGDSSGSGEASDASGSDEEEDEGEEEEEEEEEEGEDASGSAGDDAASDGVGAAAAARVGSKHSKQGAHEPAPKAAVSGGGPKAAAHPPKGKSTEAPSAELPFTFEAPSSHAEFARWVTGRSADDMSSVIKRICACHAIALGPDNRRKMQVFFGVLLVHFDVLAQEAPLPQSHLDALVPHLLVRLS